MENKHCRNCGNQVNQDAVACLNCGCDPKKGTKNCQNCGNETIPEQIICLSCGVTLQSASSSSDNGKVVAIVSYISLIGFIIALILHNSKKTKLGAFHLAQALGLMITGILFYILLILLTLPMSGMTLSSLNSYLNFIILTSIISSITLFILLIYGIIRASKEEEKPLPLFGKIYHKLFYRVFSNNEISDYQISHFDKTNRYSNIILGLGIFFNFRDIFELLNYFSFVFELNYLLYNYLHCNIKFENIVLLVVYSIYFSRYIKEKKKLNQDLSLSKIKIKVNIGLFLGSVAILRALYYIFLYDL